MVSPDWTRVIPQPPKLTFEPQAKAQVDDHHMLARPLDRLAAVIVDMFIVLGPIYILLSAPFKNWMTTSVLSGSGGEMESLVAGMLGIAVGLVVIYQTFFHYFFRATLGKMLFDLRISPMFEGERLACWDCFVRSWLWIAQVFCLGIPFLTIFSNGKRRPLHDRVCDSIILSRTNAGVKSPAGWERGLVRGAFAFAITLAMVVLLAQVRSELGAVKSDALSSLLEREISACEVVSSTLENSGEVGSGSEDPHFRLSKAMTLYAAGLADRSCLEAEVEHELASQVPVGALTYLAQAFVYADDPETSNSYLDEVCESSPGSVECHMSNVVSKWSEEDWESVEEALAKAPRGSGYLEIWGVRHFMKQAQYPRALALLDNYLTERPLAEFAMVQRVKALFNSYRESEAESALMQALSALPQTESHDLTAWVCAQQLQNGCENLERPACRHMAKDERTKPSEIDFEQSSEALAQVLALECHSDGKLDSLSFSAAVQDQDWQTFFQANVKSQSKDKASAGHLYSQLIMSPEAPELLKIEAARRWAQVANVKQLEEMIAQWKDLSSREVWVKEGHILFERLTEMKQPQLALQVANDLVQGESLSPQATAMVANLVDTSVSSRAPASMGGRLPKKPATEAK